MGLDQYLKIRLYCSGSTFDSEVSQKQYNKIIKALKIQPCIDTQYVSVEYVIAYWRKSNAIHNWFVKNVQDGLDECQLSRVSREQLQQLVNDCKTVLSKDKKAQETLPTVSGFFFGSTEYDEYYERSLQYTVDTITKILQDPSVEGEFFYQASW